MPLWLIFKVFGKLSSIFVIWQNFVHSLTSIFAIGQCFIFSQTAKYWAENLTIWSHWIWRARALKYFHIIETHFFTFRSPHSNSNFCQTLGSVGFNFSICSISGLFWTDKKLFWSQLFGGKCRKCQVRFLNAAKQSCCWSSGYERRLMFKRSWVWILVPFTGWKWHFFTLICCKKYNDVCLKRPKMNE